MLILLSGAQRTGKKSVAREILATSGTGAVIDWDALVAEFRVEPPQEGALGHCLDELVSLVSSRLNAGVRDIVVTGRFSPFRTLGAVRNTIGELTRPTFAFRLVSDPATLTRRILEPSNPDSHRELQEALRIQADQEAAARTHDVGQPIHTSELGAGEIADRIWATVYSPVRLCSHDPSWAQEFIRERSMIAATLGVPESEIHHVGSTAAPEVIAKPIIDILLLVGDLSKADRCVEPLASLGYTFIDHSDNLEHRFFRKGDPRTHHLHIHPRGAKAAEDLLTFRNLLRSDPELRAKYVSLKEDLLRRFPTQSTLFSDHKSEFVREVLQRPEKLQRGSG